MCCFFLCSGKSSLSYAVEGLFHLVGFFFFLFGYVATTINRWFHFGTRIVIVISNLDMERGNIYVILLRMFGTWKR